MANTRFHLFAGEAYYPYGGSGDHKGVFPSVEAAQQAFAEWLPSQGLAQKDTWGEITDDDIKTVLVYGCKYGTAWRALDPGEEL